MMNYTVCIETYLLSAHENSGKRAPKALETNKINKMCPVFAATRFNSGTISIKACLVHEGHDSLEGDYLYQRKPSAPLQNSYSMTEKLTG